MNYHHLCLLYDQSTPKSRQSGALVQTMADHIPSVVHIQDVSGRYGLLQMLGISGLPALVAVESHSGLQSIEPSLQGLRMACTLPDAKRCLRARQQAFFPKNGH